MAMSICLSSTGPETTMSKAERLLAALLGILLLAVVILALLLWQRPGIGAPPSLPVVDAPVAPTPSIERNTALLAYSSAQTEALAWQPDARLVQAEATWTQGASGEDLLNGKATWNFTFDSPSAGAFVIISVIDDEARLIAENSSAQAINVHEVSGWQVDSPQAVARMMQEGGEAFLRNAGVTTMTASLSTARAEDKIEWFVSLISMYTGNSFNARIDATSGDIIAVETTP